MGKAVVVSPPVVVMISSIGRNQSFNKLLHILDQAGLVFDSCQGGSGARNEKSDLPALDLFWLKLASKVGSDIYDVAESRSFLEELLGQNFYHSTNRMFA